MQTIHLQGGFGEKGRTSIAVDDGATFLMLDAGIKVGAPAQDYHPRLARPAAEIDALFLTHAHEDHIGALSWLLRQGFNGPVFMTAATRGEMAATLAQYARPDDLAACPGSAAQIEIFSAGERLTVGAQTIDTGHSGHVAGGTWFAVTSGGQTTLYCGDVVPHSAVFPMTPLPACDLLVLDCSYGPDTVPAADRAKTVIEWTAAHPGGSVLPTPLSGRSLELLTILPGPLAMSDDMEAPLRTQLADPDLLHPVMAARLRDRIAGLHRWTPGDPLPAMPLLVHDGMGETGPARAALDQAERAGHPVLLTGHLPEGSPGWRMHRAGTADWHRLPTHPTLPENRALWEATGRPAVIGHSCDAAALDAVQQGLPALNAGTRTGGSLKIGDA